MAATLLLGLGLIHFLALGQGMAYGRFASVAMIGGLLSALAGSAALHITERDAAWQYVLFVGSVELAIAPLHRHWAGGAALAFVAGVLAALAGSELVVRRRTRARIQAAPVTSAHERELLRRYGPPRQHAPRGPGAPAGSAGVGAAGDRDRDRW
jgi:hypothetical protein